MPGTFGPLPIMVPNPGGNWPGAAKSWETACEAADEKGRHVRWPPSECRATGALLGCVPRRFQAHTPPLPLQTLPFCRARLYVLLFCVPQIFWAHPWRGPSHASRQKLHLQEWPHSAQRRAGSPAPCTRAVRTRERVHRLRALPLSGQAARVPLCALPLSGHVGTGCTSLPNKIGLKEAVFSIKSSFPSFEIDPVLVSSD